jgi:hypothetical protein
MSLLDLPAQAYLRNPMICSPVNRVVFMSAILQNLQIQFHRFDKAQRGQVSFSDPFMPLLYGQLNSGSGTLQSAQ